MSDNKKYYYLKLKDNFFDSDEMKILESQNNGIEYQNLYLKLCLLSVKNEGKLAFKDTLPYDLNMISTITRIGIDTVKTGIEMLSSLKLIEIIDDGIMYMSDIQALIGHGSTEAERKAAYRKKIALHKNGTLSLKCPDKRPPEIEIELEKELKKEIKKDIHVCIDYDFYINLWNDFSNKFNLNSIKSISPMRKKKIDTRLKNSKTFQTDFALCLKIAGNSDFLLGRKGDWCLKFDWLIENDGNYVKVLEGNYTNRDKVDKKIQGIADWYAKKE